MLYKIAIIYKLAYSCDNSPLNMYTRPVDYHIFRKVHFNGHFVRKETNLIRYSELLLLIFCKQTVDFQERKFHIVTSHGKTILIHYI